MPTMQLRGRLSFAWTSVSMRRTVLSAAWRPFKGRPCLPSILQCLPRTISSRFGYDCVVRLCLDNNKNIDNSDSSSSNTSRAACRAWSSFP